MEFIEILLMAMAPITNPPSKWTIWYLEFWQIAVLDLPREDFFENEALNLPIPAAVTGFLENQTEAAAPENLDDNSRRLLRLMGYAMRRTVTPLNQPPNENLDPTDESEVDNFIYNLLKSLDYQIHDTEIVHSMGIYFFRVNSQRPTRRVVANIGIRWRRAPIFLLESKSRSPDAADPEPQIIAEAIAVFQSLQRRIPNLQHITLPCMTIRGTLPTFYKVFVDVQLSDAVRHGQHSDPTPTWRYETPFQLEDGMVPHVNREEILHDIIAFRNEVIIFRQFLEDHGLQDQVPEGEVPEGEVQVEGEVLQDQVLE